MKNGFNENGYNIANLIILRDNLKRDKSEVTLEMVWYVNPIEIAEGEYIPACDTPACVVGHGTRYFPVLDDEIDEDGEMDYTAFSERLFCDDFRSNEWDFIFGSVWLNDIDEAIARINYVIKHGNCPEEWDYDMRFAGERSDLGKNK